MPKIHPTAIIDSCAELAADVEIGPGCVIEGPVVVGPGCRLLGHVYLHGQVRLGQQNLLYPNVCLGFEPQDRKFGPGSPTAGVVIGDRNILREGAVIHSSTQLEHPTTVGDDNLLMTNAHVGHDCLVGSRCNLITGCMLGGHVRLDDQVNVGGGAAVHQFCRMGRMSFLGGVSAISKDLPPFCVASGGVNNVVGLNLVGLRRSGAPRTAIDQVNAAFRTLYLAGHSNPVAAALIEQRAAEGVPGADLLREFAQFVRESQRGLCPHSTISAGHRIRR